MLVLLGNIDICNGLHLISLIVVFAQTNAVTLYRIAEKAKTKEAQIEVAATLFLRHSMVPYIQLLPQHHE